MILSEDEIENYSERTSDHEAAYETVKENFGLDSDEELEGSGDEQYDSFPSAEKSLEGSDYESASSTIDRNFPAV